MPQQVIDTRGEAEKIAKNMEAIGQSIGNLRMHSNATMMARHLAQTNPALLQQLAVAHRQWASDPASHANPKAQSPSEQIGLPKQLSFIASQMFPESIAEQHNRTGVAGGEGAAESEAATAMAQAQKSQANFAKVMTDNLFKGGGAEMEASAKLLQDKLQIYSINRQMQMYDYLNKYMTQLTPDQMRDFVLTSTNPQFMDHLDRVARLNQEAEHFVKTNQLEQARLTLAKLTEEHQNQIAQDHLALDQATNKRQTLALQYQLYGDAANAAKNNVDMIMTGQKIGGQVGSSIMKIGMQGYNNARTMQADMGGQLGLPTSVDKLIPSYGPSIHMVDRMLGTPQGMQTVQDPATTALVHGAAAHIASGQATFQDPRFLALPTDIQSQVRDLVPQMINARGFDNRDLLLNGAPQQGQQGLTPLETPLPLPGSMQPADNPQGAALQQGFAGLGGILNNLGQFITKNAPTQLPNQAFGGLTR